MIRFICDGCKAAADLIKRDEPERLANMVTARHLHAKCRGGSWCDCQHVEVQR